MKEETYYLFKGIGKYSKDDKFVTKINTAIDELSQHGRTMPDGKVSRAIAMRMRKAHSNGHIYFGWDRKISQSVVSLKPGYKIKRTSNRKIKLIPPEKLYL